MQRNLIVFLCLAVVLALPVWPFSRDWGAAPAVILGFLLLVNLLLYLFARGRDEQS
jgi:hypothetical protein